MKVKKCFKCLEEKEITEFYVHKQMADGHINKCKACTKLDTSTKDPILYERRKKRDRNRKNSVERVQKVKENLKWIKENDPIKWRAYLDKKNEYNRGMKHKRYAHNKVSKALLSGKIIRPIKCTKCDSVEKLQAHHHDYDKPLDVEWLCIPCHAKEHRIDLE